MNMTKNSILVVMTFLPTLSCLAKEPVLPDGWRLPAVKEIAEKWRAEHPERFTVVDGDFDGDKRPDKAMLLLKTDGKGFGLFVWLAKNPKKPISLIEEKEMTLFMGMGIRPVKPATVKTACGKGYGDCEPGEPSEL